MQPFSLSEAQLNEPIARHVRQDFPTINPAWTVAEALEHMRKAPPPGRFIYFYVVDENAKLVGVVPTRRLLLSAADALISAIMIRNVVCIPSDATVLEACEFFTFHKFLAFPVIDAERRMVGVVDIELYAAELAETGEDDDAGAVKDEIFQIIGVRLTRQQQVRPLRAFRGRFPWLLCNVAGGTIMAFLTGFYEHELRDLIALALFIPMVLALAESVAIQSVTLTLDSFRGSKATWSDLLHRSRSEVVTGLLLGAATGLMVALIAFTWKQMALLSVIVLGGIAIGVAAAAVVGLAVPYVLRLLHRDPQVAAGPLALTIADVLTLLAYFNLARLLV